MDAFFFYLYAIVLALVSMALIYFRWQRSRKRSARNHFDPSGNWPKVAVIVPVRGASHNLVPCLASLLTQDYPSYEMIFVTQSSDDSATPVIRQEIRNHPHARHVFGGPAVRCGQKNQNLLSGIKEAGDDAEILVFCDSTRLAHSGWLKALVEPIVGNEAVVAASYHQVIPQDRRIFSLAHAITVFLLHNVQRIGWLTQPWGGSTAISKEVFKDLDVETLWSRNVVDDVSLAARLKEAGIKVKLAPDACLLTPLANEDLAGWSKWLTRQVLYLKFCLPVSWVVGGIFFYLFMWLIPLAGLLCLGMLPGWTSPATALLSGLFLLLLCGAAVSVRSFHPSPGPLFNWLVAFFTVCFMAGWCYFKSLFTQKIHWRGICYHVGWGGKVREIIH